MRSSNRGGVDAARVRVWRLGIRAPARPAGAIFKSSELSPKPWFVRPLFPSSVLLRCLRATFAHRLVGRNAPGAPHTFAASSRDMPPKTRRAGAPASATPGFFQRHDNVYAYVPNLIGYARVILAGVALAHAFTDVRLSLAAYLLSFVCDELDGRFARKFDQCSELGKVLDMVRSRAGSLPRRASSPRKPPVAPRAHTSPPSRSPPPATPSPQVTDRLATAGLLMVLSREYPDHFFACLSLVLLDIGSHWLQMYSQLLASKSSHKDVDPTANVILRLYYTNRIFMGVCCVSAEVLYLCAHAATDAGLAAIPGVPGILPASVAVPIPALPFIPGFAAARVVRLGGGDAALTQIAALTLPGWIVKQAANVGQICSSCRTLVAHDVPSEVRAKAKRR